LCCHAALDQVRCRRCKICVTGHGRVDEHREDPCSFRAVADRAHQITQRQKTHGESAYTDGGNTANRTAVDPAGCPRTDGESDAVHGGEESNWWHGGCTDLDDYVWHVRQHGVGDVADQIDQVGPNQEAPEKRTARRWFSW
jgi:hypothetical protein